MKKIICFILFLVITSGIIYAYANDYDKQLNEWNKIKKNLIDNYGLGNKKEILLEISNKKIKGTNLHVPSLVRSDIPGCSKWQITVDIVEEDISSFYKDNNSIKIVSGNNSINGWLITAFDYIDGSNRYRLIVQSNYLVKEKL